MAKFPRFFNFFLDASVIKAAIRKTIGYVDAPLLSQPNLRARLSGLHCDKDLSVLSSMSNEERRRHVVVVQDPFTSFYDAESVEHLVKVIHALGLQAVVLPFSPNGKAQHVKGFLAKFEKTASSTAELLNKVASLNIPMVGIDASLVLCYRDEYKKILGSKRGDFEVLTATEWLTNLASPQQDILAKAGENTANKPQAQEYNLLAHCTEKTALPKSEQQWKDVFSLAGLSLHIKAVGCCGMAGTYGHELEQLDNSKGIYELSWSGVVKQSTVNNQEILATGYSCRSQVKRFEAKRPKHPIEVLSEALTSR
jgi:Fe-S oxidoreductase